MSDYIQISRTARAIDEAFHAVLVAEYGDDACERRYQVEPHANPAVEAMRQEKLAWDRAMNDAGRDLTDPRRHGRAA